MDARYEIYRREEAYRFYVADSLFYQGQGKALGLKYGELLDKLEHPLMSQPVDGDEIVIDIMTKYGLRFEDNDTI